MILILNQPDNDSLQSAGNDTFITVSSDTQTEGVTDYKYVADVYVNTELVATLKSFPDPDYNIGVFNVRNIPASFTRSLIDLFTPVDASVISLFGQVTGGDSQVVLSIGEEYLDDGVYVSNKNVLQSNEFNFINSSLDFIDSDLNQYVVSQVYPSGATSGNFLGSSSPIFNTKDNYTWPDMRQYAYFYLNEDNNYQVQADIITYDHAGNMLGHYQTAPYTFIGGNRGLKYLTVGYTQLQSFTDYAVVTGSSSIITDQVASYTVQLRNTSPGDLLPAINHYYVRNHCTRNKRWNVYWLDKNGAFQSWRFDGQSTETVNKTQKDYKKIYGALESTGDIVINSHDRNTKTFYTSLETNVSITTDFLTDNQVLHLKDLFSSPEIYIEDLDGSGKIVSVTIPDGSYELNKRVNKKIYSLKINFKLAYNDFRQIG